MNAQNYSQATLSYIRSLDLAVQLFYKLQFCNSESTASIERNREQQNLYIYKFQDKEPVQVKAEQYFPLLCKLIFRDPPFKIKVKNLQFCLDMVIFFPDFNHMRDYEIDSFFFGNQGAEDRSTNLDTWVQAYENLRAQQAPHPNPQQNNTEEVLTNNWRADSCNSRP